MIYPKGDYSDPKLSRDEHHHAVRGSVYSSRAFAPFLRRYLDTEK